MANQTIPNSGLWSSIAAILNNNFDQSANLDQDQMLYVSKVGSDSNTGLSINQPKLTIGAAITAASLLTPAESNQFTIEVIDTGDYTESPSLPEWVHLDAVNASLNGRLTISDNTITRFRRLQNDTIGQPVVRKTDGLGFAKIAVDLLIISNSGQEGLLVDSGVAHLDVGVITVDAGIGIKAKNGSRVSFIISEVQLLNGGLGIGTKTAGGSPNFFSGNVLYAKDDGTGTLLEAKVSGDVLNIQGGSFIVNELFDMGANTTLNIFSTESSGTFTIDPTATVNVTKAGSDSKLTTSLGFLTQALSIHDGTAGTETTIDFGTFNDGVYDLANGVVEVLQDIQNVQVLTETHVTKTLGGSDSVFSAWVELSSDGGSTWTPFPDSLRVEVMAKDGGSVVISELSLGSPIAAGGMFRIRATNTGSAAISVLAPNDLTVSTGTADGFATKVTLRTRLA